MSFIRRKTIAIKADNLTDVLTSNAANISESVANFQKLQEDSQQNDVALNFQSKKENYEKQIEKLSSRLEKQQKQSKEIASLAKNLSGEVEQLEYERGQY